jgi:hypothetical protein
VKRTKIVFLFCRRPHTFSVMQTSLTTRTNIYLLLCMGAVLTGCFALGAPLGLKMLLPFAICGLVVGLLQASVVKAKPEQFLAAKTWTEVRSTLTATTKGKVAIGLVWLNGLAVLALVFFGGKLATLPAVLAAYCSFVFVRELATFRTIHALAAHRT